jgi:hypothetical protein
MGSRRGLQREVKKEECEENTNSVVEIDSDDELGPDLVT